MSNVIQGSSNPGVRALTHSKSHDEFVELCAVATTGELTEEEQERLNRHLATCPSCRELMQQYRQTVRRGMPAFAPKNFPEGLAQDSSWSEEQAEAALFARLDQEEKKPEEGCANPSATTDSGFALSSPTYAQAGDAIWRHVWLQYAAGVLLLVALGYSVYRVGLHRGSELSQLITPPPPQRTEELASQLSDAGHDRELVNAAHSERDRMIAELRRQLQRQTEEIARLTGVEAQLEADLKSGNADRQQLAKERSDLAQQLEQAQARVQGVGQKLESLTQESAEASARATRLEARVTELTQEIQQRDQNIERQQELLAHDRDIRDLIGARDLYIAEVYDVARTGATQKPYGRVFYTKGKSLIFYAYDLDQQSGFKNASTFQVWGRRGPDRQQAVNLGMFFQDDAAKKRWILKSNDPKTLAQIDAVFVTVEPKGGSHTPSGKQLLFAYLRIEPNHP